MTKARDLEEGVDWLSGARDLEQTSSASYVPASKAIDGVIDASLDGAARLGDLVRQSCLTRTEASRLMRMARPQIAGLLEGDWERLGPSRHDQQQHSTRQELLRSGRGRCQVM